MIKCKATGRTLPETKHDCDFLFGSTFREPCSSNQTGFSYETFRGYMIPFLFLRVPGTSNFGTLGRGCLPNYRGPLPQKSC